MLGLTSGDHDGDLTRLQGSSDLPTESKEQVLDRVKLNLTQGGGNKDIDLINNKSCTTSKVKTIKKLFEDNKLVEDNKKEENANKKTKNIIKETIVKRINSPHKKITKTPKKSIKTPKTKQQKKE